MQHDPVWRWVYRDPVTGRIRTDGLMTEREAERYPGAMRIPGFRSHPRSADIAEELDDRQAEASRNFGNPGEQSRLHGAKP